MMKRCIVILLVLMLSISFVLAGCTKESEDVAKDSEKTENNDEVKSDGNSNVKKNDGQEEKSEAADQTTENTTINPYKKYDPPITLTTGFKILDSEAGWWEDEGPDGSNALTRWCEDVMGIKWEASFVTSTDDELRTQFNLSMASNDLPDLINKATPDMIAKMSKSGQIIPLDDLLDDWASPLVKGVLGDWDNAMNGMYYTPFVNDGRKYAFPETPGGVTPNLPHFRVDILEELGKKLPSDITELEDVFAAYKKSYPDGVCMIMDQSLGNGFRLVANAYLAFPDMWIEKDGELVYGSVQPEMKNALEKLAEWYEAGYLDSDFYLKDINKTGEDVSGNNALMYDGQWYHVYHQYNARAAYELDDTVKVLAGPIITGPSGKQVARQYQSTNSGCGYAISAKCENPEAMIVYLNWTADSGFRDQKDLQEKYDFQYDFELQKLPVNQDEIDKAKEAKEEEPESYFDYMSPGPGNGADQSFFNDRFFPILRATSYGFLMPNLPGMRVRQFKQMEEAYTTGDWSNMAPGAENGWWGNSMLFESFFSDVNQFEAAGGNAIVQMDGFQSSPTATMSDKGAYLDKTELEVFTKIIIGELPVDAFDDFVNDWETNGGNEITSEVNEWYSVQ